MRTKLPWFWVSTAVGCVLTLARLLPHLSDRVMHRDEALTLMLARYPLGDMLETVQLVRGGAPLHFLLAKLTAETGHGLASTRAISVAFAVLAVVGCALLGRALCGELEGAALGLVVAVSPVALYYGEFARMYSMFLAFTALALWCLVRALDSGDGRSWAGAAAFITLDVYSHPYGVLVAVICAITAAVKLGRDRSAWRLPLRAAGCALLAVLPLAAGYLVLASRLGGVKTTSGAEPYSTPRLTTLEQAYAHFLGVPRSVSPLVLSYLVVCTGFLLFGGCALARRDRGRATLLLTWTVLPLLVFAAVHVPGTDNHVRYLIDLLPLVPLLVLHGAVRAVRSRGREVGLAIAGLLIIVTAVRGSGIAGAKALADYRYQAPLERLQAAPKHRDLDALNRFVRERFSSGDLFFGYDPAWAYPITSPAGNSALASARGVARSEGPLIARSLERLGSTQINHGWYTTVVPKPTARAAIVQRLDAAGFDAAQFAGRYVVAVTHDKIASHQAFLERGLAFFEAVKQLNAPARDVASDTTISAINGAIRAIR